MPDAGLVGLEEVREAARSVEGVALRTPFLALPGLSESLGGEVRVKAESLQRGGSFKFRGAFHYLSRLDAEVRGRGVITYSSGNHAQAVALAARIHGVRCVVVMPVTAPAVKREGAAAHGADLAIEAVFEDMALKERLFGDLDRILPEKALLASNTSSLDIDALAGATGRPDRVLGLHYFSPANVMKLLEIVWGKATSGEALASALALARQTGKHPVIAGNCPSFIGNRILRQRHHQAELLLQQGASPAEVDKAVTGFGMAMGPFQMNDLAGLDVGSLVRRAQGYALPVADALVARGRLGQKTGAGYYRYDDGRTPLPDPETASIITAVSAELGVTPRSFSGEEICQRLFYPMVNEAARILEEGIAARPGDIDVVYVHGYGFPAWRGGLLHWADTEGLDAIAAALTLWAEESGEARLQVAPLLAKLVREGRGFADWDESREG